MHRPTNDESSTSHARAQENIAFADIEQAVSAARPLEQTLQLIATRTRDTLPGDTEISISTSTGTAAATGSRARSLDERQHHAGQGPTVDAAASGHTITIDIDDPGHPYTSFGDFATSLYSLRSVTAAALPMINPRGWGALTVYTFGIQPPPRPVVGLVENFAAYTAVAIAAADDGLLYDLSDMARHAQAAARRAAAMETAKGITMERYACTGDTAQILITIAAQQADIPPDAYAHALVNRRLQE